MHKKSECSLWKKESNDIKNNEKEKMVELTEFNLCEPVWRSEMFV